MFQDINYGSMVEQTREKFIQGAYKQILQQFKTTRLYSEKVKQLPHDEIFKNTYWHPGKQDQKTLTCFITASNMVAGGPLFDSPEKFHALYESRAHIQKRRNLEMPWEEGYCYKNLPYLFYDPNEDQWFSPILTRVFSGVILRNMKANIHQGWWGLLETENPDRKFIIQVLIRNIANKDGKEELQQQCHAAVVVKDQNQWLLLDSAEDGPIEITPDGDRLSDWYQGVLYIAMLAIRPDSPPQNKREAFKREWQRIMNGEMVIRQGGNRKLIQSSRKSCRKDRRTNPHNQGNKQQRTNKSSMPVSTSRKSRAEQLIGKRTDKDRDADAQRALLESTQKAREKRSQMHNNSKRTKLENILAEHVLMMQKTKLKLEKMFHYTSSIGKLDVLPFPADVQQKLQSPEEDSEIVQAAHSWVVLEGSRAKLAHFKTQIIADGGQQKLEEPLIVRNDLNTDWVEEKFQKIILSIEEQLFSFTLKMFQENPFIPYSLVNNIKRIISKTKATEIQRRYEQEIKLEQENIKKDNDPRVAPAEARTCYLQTIKLINKL